MKPNFNLSLQELTEDELKKLIAEHIVEEMRMIESPSFTCILNKIPVYGKKAVLPDRKNFSCCTYMEIELKKTFEGLEYIILFIKVA